MGAVIDLQAWRQRREPAASGGRSHQDAGPRRKRDQQPLPHLENAVARLERVMRSGTGRISARVETELLAITGAVAAGRMREAARRAERLAERLEHPSSRLAR